MPRVEGIEVTAADNAAWDAAVSAFEQFLHARRLRQALLRPGGSAEARPLPPHGESGGGSDGQQVVGALVGMYPRRFR